MSGFSVLLVCLVTGCAGIGSSPTPSPKRGVASADYLATNPGLLGQLHASWAYDWKWGPPPASTNMHWVPMVWGAREVTPKVIAALIAQRKSGRATDLLGFNEPDNRWQSHMTPTQAADLWPQLVSTGLRLGAPAPASLFDGWLATFMKLALARGLRVDFLTVHVYQDFTDPHAVTELRGELTVLYRAYHKPIWITEIGALGTNGGVGSTPGASTFAAAQRYEAAVTPMLDSLPFVQRYAWYTDNCWPSAVCRYSSLFNAQNQLTAIGKQYAQSS